jgi:SET domain-containing protein
MILSSWISPKTQKGLPSKIHGLGFFAVKDISKGEILAVKAGHIINRDTLRKNQGVIKHSQMQISDDLYIAPLTTAEFLGSMIYFNHCCAPNAVVEGQIVLKTMRDVVAGEELTFDYATLFNDESRFDCTCGVATCRKVITGKDWKKPKLQQKYNDNFAAFILEKIRKP